MHPAQYTLLRELGQGTFGAVHAAEDESGQLWAAKCVPLSPRHADQFPLKLATLQKVRSPFLACLVASFSTSRNHYLVQEYCHGGSLQAYLALHGPIPEPHLGRFLHQIATGLLVLKQYEVLHCNLKPANLLLTSSDLNEATVKIADFGLFNCLEVIKPKVSDYGYTAPEILAGHLGSFPADIWSFATIAYEMATGHALFSGSLLKVATKQRNPVCLAELSPSLSDLLSPIFTLNPQDRPTIEGLLSHSYFSGFPSDSPVQPPLPSGPVTSSSLQYDSIPRPAGRRLVPMESIMFLDDDYLVLDYEEESRPEELETAAAIYSTLVTEFASIETVQVKSLDKATLCYCHFTTRLLPALQQLFSVYKQLEIAQEFEQFHRIWVDATALVIKLQSKLLSLEGALPLFLDEKVIKVCIFGETLQASKSDLELQHQQSLSLITALADELTRPIIT